MITLSSVTLATALACSALPFSALASSALASSAPASSAPASSAPAKSALPTAAPVVNVDALFSAIADMGFAARLRDDGVLEVNLGDGARFVGKFSAYPYKSGGTGRAECGSVVLQERASWARHAANASRFVAVCENGTHQDILPVVDNSAFFNLLTNSNLDYAGGNRYGSLWLPMVDSFYADHIIMPLLPADQALLDSSNDPSGVLLRVHSVNADGSLNYEVLTATGKQIFYGGQETMVEGDFIKA